MFQIQNIVHILINITNKTNMHDEGVGMMNEALKPG